MMEAAIEDHEADMALEDAMMEAAIEDHEANMALEDAMMEAAIEDHEADMALEDAMMEAAIEDHEANMALEDAMMEDDATEEHEKDIIVENVIGRNTAIPSLYVSKIDLQRLISNIVDNARKHGFTDSNRKDYEMKISLSIDSDSNSFQIDFKNNGNPLPEGMNKMRYGIKGEKAGKTAGTGIGGSYVKKFVEHYGGDYDVFMEGDWTVIRIVLPIKK
jgi:signal transduction histidine kinase